VVSNETYGLRPYPEYRDSDLPWLGEVPAHWDVRRNGRLFAQRNETGFGSLPILEVSLKTGVRVRDMENLKRKQVMTDREKYKRAAQGDIAYNMMRMWQGAVGAAPVDGLVSPAYVVARPYPEVDTRYYSYLFRTAAYMAEVDGYSRGIVKDRNRLYWQDFKRMPSCFPPPTEQSTIADYLDANATLVRKFVRNRRRLIEVLNEQKQAVINESFTCGLDPAAPVRASGIDWLGAIPQHWIVKPLKRWAAMNRLVLPETTDPDYEFSYIDIGAVGTGFLFEQPARIRFGNSPSRARRILRGGDTIISTVRTYLKAVLFIRDEPKDLIASTGFAVLSPNPGVVPEALSLAVQSKAFVDSVTANSTGIGYPAIAETRLGTLHIALPPTTKEQDAIVECINQATAQLDAAIARIQREIDLIREYRTRLITDVVTGKLDVRHLAPPPSESDLGDSEGIDAEETLDDDLDGAEEGDIAEEALNADD
jgi:type I restriction enzyme, S subunit